MILGIPINPYALNVPKNLINGAKNLSINIRIIHLPSLTVSFYGKNKTIVSDKDGIIKIKSLAPYLLFGFPAAINAFRILSQNAFCQNLVDSVLIADDKAATAEKLSKAGIPQVPTIICPADFEIILSMAKKVRFPVVIKRTHGAQGRWVRLAIDKSSLQTAFKELMEEGPGALILQPQVVEAKGTSIRVVMTGGKILAVTQRTAAENEWRSNIARGGSQKPIDLTKIENKMVLAAAKAIGLKHAGIDLLRTSKGPVILEINSCPDFTSMIPYFKKDLTKAVLEACTPHE